MLVEHTHPKRIACNNLFSHSCVSQVNTHPSEHFTEYHVCIIHKSHPQAAMSHLERDVVVRPDRSLQRDLLQTVAAALIEDATPAAAVINDATPATAPVENATPVSVYSCTS